MGHHKFIIDALGILLEVENNKELNSAKIRKGVKCIGDGVFRGLILSKNE